MFLVFTLSFFSPAQALEMNDPALYKKFEAELKSPNGVTIEVHGSDPQNGLVVIGYRPDNFFESIIISMVADYLSPNYKSVQAQLLTLKRHDIIRVKGETSTAVVSYQNHFMVNEITVLEKFTSPYDTGETYQHGTDLAQVLKGKNSLIVKVHASLLGGKVFVVEYGDANIPVVVANEALTKDLYRGDKIEIQFDVKTSPHIPMHLALHSDAKAVRMISRIADEHNKPISRCGELVLFPKSPQVKFNVFALKYDIGDGLFRLYTLINFEDMVLFQAIRDKAQAVWDGNMKTSVLGRNYYINAKIKICASGTGNMIVPTQANPQILIDKIDDIKLEVLP